MSVILKFNICEGGTCDSFCFTETTGAYSATNTEGWGTPNESTSDALTAVLSITDPSGNITSIDLYDDFPTTDEEFEKIISPSDLGLSTTKFLDGIYTFTYTVTTEANTYIQNITQAFYCQVKCCVLSMFANIDFDCDCSQDKQEEAIKAYIMLKGLEYNAGCGNKNKFNNILAQLQKLCTNKNCNNCK